MLGLQEKQSQHSLERIASLSGHDGCVLACTLAGKYVFTAGKDRSVRIFDPDVEFDNAKLEKAKVLHVFDPPHVYELSGVTVNEQLTMMACCGRDKICSVYDVATGHLTHKLFGHNGPVNSISFGGATVLATGSDDRTVRVFDLRVSAVSQISCIEGFKDSVSSIICCESTIVTGCIDGKLRIFDIVKGGMTQDEFEQPISHVTRIDQNSDLLFSCIDPGVLLRFEPINGVIKHKFFGHINNQNRISCCSMQPSNSRAKQGLVFMGSEDGAVHIWKADSPESSKKIKVHSNPVSSLSCSAEVGNLRNIIVSCSYSDDPIVHRVCSYDEK